MPLFSFGPGELGPFNVSTAFCVSVVGFIIISAGCCRLLFFGVNFPITYSQGHYLNLNCVAQGDRWVQSLLKLHPCPGWGTVESQRVRPIYQYFHPLVR